MPESLNQFTSRMGSKEWNKGRSFRSWAHSGVYIFYHKVGKCLKFRVDTFCGYLKLAALDDLDILFRAVTASLRGIFDLGDNTHALEDFPEDNVTAIEPTVHQVSSVQQFPASEVLGYGNPIVRSSPHTQGSHSRSNNSCDEELGAICVRSGIGHRKKARTSMLFIPISTKAV